MRRSVQSAALAGILACASWLGTTGAVALELTEQEAAGKQIYTQGTSPSGGTISARVGPTGTPMPASIVPCANCHGGDGRGRPEGGIRPTDITWRRLSAGYGQRLASGREHPAYDEAAFARAVTAGIDPGGTHLDQAMPRFVMSMRDMAALTAYIKRLEHDRDPGLGPGTLRIGTLQPESGRLAGLGASVAGVLRAVFDDINERGGIHGRRIELVTADPGPDRASAEAALRRLLEEEQVFAVVAPFAPQLEGDLRAIIDDAGVPVVGPIGRLAEGDGSRFLFDPLPGLHELLFALADFALAHLGMDQPTVAVLHPDDDVNRALAAALAQRLQRGGWDNVLGVGHPPGGLDAPAVARAISDHGVQGVFFLGANDDFAALAAASQDLMVAPFLFAASIQVGLAALEIAPMYSERVFLAYPTLPEDRTAAGIAALQAVRERAGLGAVHDAFQVSAYTAAVVLAEALKRSGRDASREKLVSALERLHDYRTGLTPPIGFGPAQRIGARGAHIVTVDLAKGRFLPTGHYIKLESSRQ